MPASRDSGPVQDAAPSRRTRGRGIVGIVLILLAMVLLVGGIQAIADPSAEVARSSGTPRSADSDTEAQLGGLLLCFFGLTVLGFGIALLRTKGPLWASADAPGTRDRRTPGRDVGEKRQPKS